MTTFDLWPLPWGGGAWGTGTNMWHPDPKLWIASCPSGHTDSHTLDTYIWGGRGGGSDVRSMWSIQAICKCRCPPLPVTLWRSRLYIPSPYVDSESRVHSNTFTMGNILPEFDLNPKTDSKLTLCQSRLYRPQSGTKNLASGHKQQQQRGWLIRGGGRQVKSNRVPKVKKFLI